MTMCRTSSDNQFQKGFGKIKQKVTNEINWENENIKLWKEAAQEKQTFYCATLGNKLWEEYSIEQEIFLQLKIGFSLYGPPCVDGDVSLDGLEEDEENIEKTLTQFFKEPRKKKTIDNITKLIKKHWTSEKLYIAFIYVIALVNEKYAEFPVIRLLKGQKEGGSEIVSFIDSLGRNYDNWADFLKTNDYPKCIYCYPMDGCYSLMDEKVCLEYGRSPRGKIIKKLGKNLDTVSSLTGLGSAALLVAGIMVPISAPVVAGAAAAGFTTGVWTACRTLTEMADRKKHSQSISILDPGGRSCWIALAAGILGAASSGAIQYTTLLARNGRLISKVLDVSSIGITGLGIVNQVFNFIHDAGIRHCSDIALSVLFFCHCSMTLQTAREVILEIEHRINVDMEVQLSPEQQAVFANLLMESTKCGLLEGNGKKVKSLKFIKNKDSFFNEIKTC